jgi:Tfp pilus assembly protein PilF
MRGPVKYVTAAFLVCALIACVSCSKKEDGATAAREYYKQAYQFIDAGHPTEAIDLLNLAVKKDPNFYEAYYNRGVVYYLLKNYREALADFSKAISIDPKNSSAYASRGEVYEILGENEKAYGDYRAAARMGSKETQKYLKSRGVSW